MNSYIAHINTALQPQHTESEVVLDLFAGCGGLSLGFEAAGYDVIGFEMDDIYCQTYNHNLHGTCHAIKLAMDFDYPDADIIIGGPPCQPFSVFGHQKGKADVRDGFPIFIDAVRKVEPKVFLFENVRGLFCSNKNYFDAILKQLGNLGYIVEYKLVNVVDYGVPQNRERLFVVGHRAKFEFPKRHIHRVTAGDAIGDTMYSVPDGSHFLTPSMDAYIARYEKASFCINPRDLNPSKPARTLTCRNIAAATSDMHRVRLEDGKRRRLVVREAARLQSFPDWFEFMGNEMQQFYQIGNAVPPLMALHMANAVKECCAVGTLYSPMDIIEQKSCSTTSLSLFTHEKIHQQ